jgi:hypothetical protein
MSEGQIIWRIGGLRAVFDTERAAWVSIRCVEDPNGTEFLLTPDEFPQFDGPNARWLGNLTLEASTAKAPGSRTIRTSAYAEHRIVHQSDTSTIDIACDPSDEAFGLTIAERFRKRDDDIEWTITLCNAGQEPVTIDRLGVPLLMNQFFRGDDAFKYEQCVLRHTCLIHQHSWAYWQKSSGSMPLLLMAVTGNTAADSFTVDHDPAWQHGAGPGSTFEGPYELNLVSHPSPAFPACDGPIILQPGESTRFTIAFAMRANYGDAWKWLSDIGGFMLNSDPGMVTPVGRGTHITILSARRPRLEAEQPEDQVSRLIDSGEAPVPVESGKPGESSESGESAKPNKPYKSAESGKSDEPDGNPQSGAGAHIWHATVRLGGYGRRALRVHLGDTMSRITFFGIESPEDIYRKQSAFMATHQWETDPDDPCYHGLLMWDITNRRRINRSFNPELPNWMAGGSDEIGLVSGLLLSEWNVHRPDEHQLHVLDGYCRDFIEQRLTEQPGYQVHRMVPWFEMFDPWTGRGVDDIWRAFNYVHVSNTFLNMYRIAKRYRDEYPWLQTPRYWLERAYQYATAMFSYWMFPDGEGGDHYANMGESIIATRLPEALKTEGMCEQAERLKGLIGKKAMYFAGKAYPYGSEMAYDSTAYEAVYGYGAAIDDEKVMHSSMRVALANRGRQPDWALYMTDLRGCGDSGWNVSYMTQLGAWTLYDWALERRHYEPDLLHALESSYLAGFSIFNSGGYLSADPDNVGASAWIHVAQTGETTGARIGESDGSGSQRVCKGFVPYSGESALGFFGALRSAAAFVMHDDAGNMLQGCGCALTNLTIANRGRQGYITRPMDGLRARFFDTVHDWAVILERDALTRIRYEPGLVHDDYQIVIENITGDAHICAFTLRMPTEGRYLVSNGSYGYAKTVYLGRDWTRITIPVPQDCGAIEVRISEL